MDEKKNRNDETAETDAGHIANARRGGSYKMMRAQNAWKRCGTVARRICGDRTDGSIVAVAYVAYRVASSNGMLAPEKVVGTMGDADCRDLLSRTFADGGYDEVRVLAEDFGAEALSSAILAPSRNVGRQDEACSTPASICELALAILDVKPGERVVDYGCGRGDFLMAARASMPEAVCEGVEVDAEQAAVARLRAEVAGDVDVVTGDMFEVYPATADKIFSNFPLGMQFASIASGSDYMARARQGMPEYGRPASADWAYARLVADTVARGGRGVVVMTNGALANGSDARIRRYFLDHGLVEAVIALPAHILGKSDVSLVVLGHDAGPVRMVDASDLGHEGRRQSTLDEKAIACVIDRLSRDGDHSKLVDSCVLGDARYVLDPRRFLGEILDDAVPFSSIVVSIGRGAALSAADLDTLSAEPDTHVRYLMASNIMGGLVAEDLPCLKVDDLKLDRYRLVDGDLVISKLGLPFKVAVAEVPAGETVLAVGNVFVVRLDPAKADPYFVAAYLSGHVGQNLLSRVSSGTNVPMLPISALRTLPVPDRPMDEQRGLGKRYRKAVEDARDLRATAERALEDALSLFDGKE